MAALENPGWERFIHGVFSGMTHKAAWKAAGYAGYAQPHVSKVFNLPQCKKRMAELQALATEKATNAAVVNRAQLAAEFEDIKKLALKGKCVTDRDGNPVKVKNAETGDYEDLHQPDLANALRAVEGKGKLFGLFVDVQREENLDDFLEGKNIDELREQLAGEIHDLDPNLHKRKVAAAKVVEEDDDEDGEVIESVPEGARLQ